MKIWVLVVVFLNIAPIYALEFTHESQFSLVQASGNTNFETYNFALENSWKKEMTEISIGGHYTLGSSQVDEDGEKVKKETARNWDIHTKVTREISEFIAGFLKVKIEGDKFAGLSQRDNYDLGGKYTFIKNDKNNIFLELGLRYAKERIISEDENGRDIFYDQKGRVYLESNSQKSKEISYKVGLEYIPNFSRSRDYQIIFGPSLGVALSDIFSLKIAYQASYDNQPAVVGNRYLDSSTSTTLIAKF